MLSNLIVFLYALLPVTLLTSHSLPSAVFYALVASSLALLVQRKFDGTREQTYRYRWLIASFAVLFVSVLISSTYYGKWAGANSEGALRFFLGLWLMLLALPYISLSKLRLALVSGAVVSGVISSAVLIWMITYVSPRPMTPGLILPTYTGVMLILGAICIYSLKWQLTPWPYLEKFLKLVVPMVVFYAFVIAQTRTGLMGLPIFVLLGAALFFGLKNWRRLLVWSTLALAVLVLGAMSNGALRDRVVLGIDEVQSCQVSTGNNLSSMCLRLQLWNVAIDAGISNPLVGLGDGGRFNQYIEQSAVSKGLATIEVVEAGFGEPHSDWLMFFAAFGFPGLAGLLFIYFVPAIVFALRFKATGTSSAEKVAAVMGLAFCLGFAVFGLTETMFRRMNTMGFYSFYVALFMVLSQTQIRKFKKSPTV